jgi:hypothetical protein
MPTVTEPPLAATCPPPLNVVAPGKLKPNEPLADNGIEWALSGGGLNGPVLSPNGEVVEQPPLAIDADSEVTWLWHTDRLTLPPPPEPLKLRHNGVAGGGGGGALTLTVVPPPVGVPAA